MSESPKNSMNDAIKVEGLSKRYRIGGRESYGTLRDTLAASFTSPMRRVASIFKKSDAQQGEGASVWALKDITFSARPGEVVGIVGRNGSGKSTLLKILSRITSPTHGVCEVRGNVALPAGGGNRVSSGTDRPREHLPQRRDPRDEAKARLNAKFRRDRGFRREWRSSSTPR